MAAPTRVTHDLTSITLQWTAPTADGDSDVTQYILYSKADFETTYSQVYKGMALTYKVSSLKTGFEYQFKVRSGNASGLSEFSAASTSIITALVPQPPTGIVLVARSASEITFEWVSPEDRGGVELDGFNVYMAEENEEFTKVGSAPATLNPTVLWHSESELTAGIFYRFKVSSVNQIGESDLTDEIKIIAADLPEAPASPPVVTLVTETSISLTIAAIPEASNGGTPITGYFVEIDDGNGGPFTRVHDSLTLDLILSNLKSGTTYQLRYAGRNLVYDANNMFECDHIHYSAVIVVLTAVDPTLPLRLHHDTSMRYKTALIYNWDPPASNGGSPLQVFTLGIKSEEGSVEEVEFVVTVQATSYKFESLEPALTYDVRIKVNNLVGESDWSEYVSARTGIAPVRPGLFTFEATTRTTLDLSWT